jgi:HPt (histidine-containing phosphotransfer) domain-containing protein
LGKKARRFYYAVVKWRMDLALIFSQLNRIEGLDYWEGLAHVGCSQEVYVDALRLFCTDLENKCVSLNEFFKKENWRGYSAAIHAIKGGLAGIGAWRLERKVKELEDAVRSENYGFCRETTGSVLQEMEQFAKLLQSGALFNDEKIEREQVSLDYLEEKLSELYLFCSFGSSAEADALARELKTKTCDREADDIVNTVCTHVENLDYHLVLQILAEQPYIKNR